jgi:hypothetical protein
LKLWLSGEKWSKNMNEPNQDKPRQFPPDTSISKLGLNDGDIALLTGKALKLNKSDLQILRWVGNAHHAAGEEKVLQIFADKTGKELKMSDIDSVTQVFNRMQDRVDDAEGPMLVAPCCCCPCSCCCCASVVTDPKR